MLARKDNKVYNIDASQKTRYSKEGFDIYDDDGTLISYAETKTIKYNEHVNILAKKDEQIKLMQTEIKKLNAEIEKLNSEINKPETDKKGSK